MYFNHITWHNIPEENTLYFHYCENLKSLFSPLFFFFFTVLCPYFNALYDTCQWFINPLNAELNPICHLLALLGAHHILHVSRKRVNVAALHTDTKTFYPVLYIWIAFRIFECLLQHFLNPCTHLLLVLLLFGQRSVTSPACGWSHPFWGLYLAAIILILSFSYAPYMLTTEPTVLP
jgi:hypothetical protein